MAELEITLIPLLQDNYGYLLQDRESGTTGVVDPSEPESVLELLGRRGGKLDFILNTHHHWDHTGGNERLKSATGARVVGPRADAARIPAIDIEVSDEAPFWFGKAQARILEIPGHTRGHIAYWFSESHAVFCGDTLFAMGCGRLFEGTPGQMWESLGKLAKLPPETRIYCGHEYTEANARFAVTVDPMNQALKARFARVRALRVAGQATIPSTIRRGARDQSLSPRGRARGSRGVAPRDIGASEGVRGDSPEEGRVLSFRHCER